MNRENMSKPASYCDECVHRRTCTLQFEENRRTACPILKGDDEPILYRNSEGYSDPTAYFALRDVARDEKRKRRNAQRGNAQRGSAERDSAKRGNAQRGSGAHAKKRRHRNLVARYDD